MVGTELAESPAYHVAGTLVIKGDIDVVYVETENLRPEDRNKPSGAVASKLKDGRPQVVVYNKNAAPGLFHQAMLRAKNLKELAFWYPEGQWGYYLHTFENPQPSGELDD